TLPLLVGLDGSRKMSKSYDNYIAFNDSPKDIFGKTMSISDDVMWDYYRLLLLRNQTEVEALQKIHPMECKKQLAHELTALFYGVEEAQKESDAFSQVFSKGQDPDDMPEISLASIQDESPTLLNVLAGSKLFESKGQIRRLISQGAIKIDGEKIEDADLDMTQTNNANPIIKAGKKLFLRVIP
ncbi:MAG: tyrosine--tRNA ligase, partial [Opitutae bacterium]